MNLLKWLNRTGEEVRCRGCSGQSFGGSYKNASKLFCNGACQKLRPDHYFFEEHLKEWRLAQDESLFRCARCALMERADTLEDGLPDKQCNQCEDLKPLTEFTAVDIKFGYWSKTKGGYDSWRCYDCAFPTCTFVDCSGKVSA